MNKNMSNHITEEELIFQQEILNYLKTNLALNENQQFMNKVKDLFPNDFLNAWTKQ